MGNKVEAGSKHHSLGRVVLCLAFFVLASLTFRCRVEREGKIPYVSQWALIRRSADGLRAGLRMQGDRGRPSQYSLIRPAGSDALSQDSSLEEVKTYSEREQKQHYLGVRLGEHACLLLGLDGQSGSKGTAEGERPVTAPLRTEPDPHNQGLFWRSSLSSHRSSGRPGALVSLMTRFRPPEGQFLFKRHVGTGSEDRPFGRYPGQTQRDDELLTDRTAWQNSHDFFAKLIKSRVFVTLFQRLVHRHAGDTRGDAPGRNSTAVASTLETGSSDGRNRPAHRLVVLHKRNAKTQLSQRSEVTRESIVQASSSLRGLTVPAARLDPEAHTDSYLTGAWTLASSTHGSDVPVGERVSFSDSDQSLLSKLGGPLGLTPKDGHPFTLHSTEAAPARRLWGKSFDSKSSTRPAGTSGWGTTSSSATRTGWSRPADNRSRQWGTGTSGWGASGWGTSARRDQEPDDAWGSQRVPAADEFLDEGETADRRGGFSSNNAVKVGGGMWQGGDRGVNPGLADFTGFQNKLYNEQREAMAAWNEQAEQATAPPSQSHQQGPPPPSRGQPQGPPAPSRGQPQGPPPPSRGQAQGQDKTGDSNARMPPASGGRRGRTIFLVPIHMSHEEPAAAPFHAGDKEKGLSLGWRVALALPVIVLVAFAAATAVQAWQLHRSRKRRRRRTAEPFWKSEADSEDAPLRGQEAKAPTRSAAEGNRNVRYQRGEPGATTDEAPVSKSPVGAREDSPEDKKGVSLFQRWWSLLTGRSLAREKKLRRMKRRDRRRGKMPVREARVKERDRVRVAAN